MLFSLPAMEAGPFLNGATITLQHVIVVMLRGQLGRQQFARRVEAAGLQKIRMSEGYCFVGISLR
ncbi:MAG: hypothetical protein CMG96_10850 [Marinovum sp.]|nr:hypothetical protein [Marinovum sp.]